MVKLISTDGVVPYFLVSPVKPLALPTTTKLPLPHLTPAPPPQIKDLTLLGSQVLIPGSFYEDAQAGAWVHE